MEPVGGGDDSRAAAEDGHGQCRRSVTVHVDDVEVASAPAKGGQAADRSDGLGGTPSRPGERHPMVGVSRNPLQEVDIRFRTTTAVRKHVKDRAVDLAEASRNARRSTLP